MKFLKIFFISIYLLISFGKNTLYANTLSPSINEITVSQGQRTYSTVTFQNDGEKDTEVLIKIYSYNPQTDEISENSEDLFLKADTDTFLIEAGQKKSIQYEIAPISNMELGTYFNLLTLLPEADPGNVSIAQGISQLVVLNLVSAEDEVLGITTNDFSPKIELVSKGIPYILPLKIRYIYVNQSNFVLTPSGRIEVFNKRGDYMPKYIYVNQEGEKLYPGEQLEKTVEIHNWHLSDLFSDRYVLGNFTNGLDSNPKLTEISVPSYTIEIFAALVVLIVGYLFIKSLREDKKGS